MADDHEPRDADTGMGTDTDTDTAEDPGVDPAAKTQPAEGGVDEVEAEGAGAGATGGDPSRALDEG